MWESVSMGNIDLVAGVLLIVQLAGIVTAITAGVSAVVIHSIQNRIQPQQAEKSTISSKLAPVFVIVFAVAGFFISAWWTGSYALAFVGAAGFGALGYATPHMISQIFARKMERYLSTIATLFEIGIKTNVPVEKIFYACATTIKHERLSMALKRAGAVYVKTRDIDQAFSEIETELNSPEVKLLKSAVKEIERVGTSALIALQTFANMQNLRINDYLSRRKESATTYSTIAIAMVLFAAMMVYFAPIYRLIMQSMIQFFQ